MIVILILILINVILLVVSMLYSKDSKYDTFYIWVAVIGALGAYLLMMYYLATGPIDHGV